MPRDNNSESGRARLTKAFENRMVAEVNEAVSEWRSRNYSIKHHEFQDLKQRIAENEHPIKKLQSDMLMINAEAEKLGEIAAKYDIGLAEIGDNINSGHLRGIRRGGGNVVPVLVCINRETFKRLNYQFDIILTKAQQGAHDIPMADGGGLKSPTHTAGQPAENLLDEDRWFCMTVYNGNKVPVAPWIDENPEGEDTAWDQPVGHNWDGVKTDYETAEKWADMIDGWFLATRIGDYDEKETSRLHLIDFDNVRDPETGEVHPEAKQVMDRLNSYAQVSYSGTGVHIYVTGPVPEEYKHTGFEEELAEWKHSDKFDGPPEVEGYSRSRFIAITENHIDSTPTEAKERPELLEGLYEQYGEVDDEPDTPDDFDGTYDREPELTKTEIRTTEETGDWDVIFDAIAHTEPSFAGGRVRLRSEVTHERRSGIYDLDPSWEVSQSGTRLGYDDGFIYRKGDTGLDTLQVVALEERIIHDVGEYPEGEDFHEAVEALRERGAHIPEYNSELREEESPLSLIPIERIRAMEHSELRRYADRRGIEWPDVEEVRERLHDSLLDAVEHDDYTVKSAPTGAGKTHAVATEDWLARPDVTDEKPVIHAHRTREARDQAREMSEDADVDAYTLKGRTELCPVAAGHYDPGNTHNNRELVIDNQPISDWLDHRCDRQGIPFSHAHRWAEEEIDGPMPCQEGDTECAALGQFDGIPRNDDGYPVHDVIHCTHQFLYVPSLRMHTHVFLDEKPAFGIDLDPPQVRESVNAYLDYVDAPVDNYSELVRASQDNEDPDAPKTGTIEGVPAGEHHEGFRERMDEAFNGYDERVECPECKGEGEIHDGRGDNQDLTAYPEHAGARASTSCPECNGTGSVIENRGHPPLEWYRQTPKAHSLAPAFARAIWNAEESSADRKHARVPYQPPRWGNEQHDEAGWNRVHVDVVLNGQWEVVASEQVPDFSLTDSVIGLDAHPKPADPFWLSNVHPDMTTDYTLDTNERSRYRLLERGLMTIQVGNGIQPVASGEWLDQGQGQKFDAIVSQLADQHDDFDSAITSSAAEKFVTESMEDAGIEEPETMHYGEEESRNDFEGKKVGLVSGSIDPGDNTVVNLCARLGYDVEPSHKTCPVCDGTGHVEVDGGDVEWCETCHGDGTVRERGRTFDGEDAEQAKAVLEGVREHHVAQGAGRYARNAEDPEDYATVYIVTEAAPEGFIDAKAPGPVWTTNDEQKERLKYVRDNEHGVTAKQVAEACDCTKQTAWRTLSKAEEEGLIERTPGSGPYGADVFSPSKSFNEKGSVELGDVTAEDIASGKTSLQPGYEDTITWTVMIDALPHCAYNEPKDERDPWQHQSTLEWFELGPPAPNHPAGE